MTHLHCKRLLFIGVLLLLLTGNLLPSTPLTGVMVVNAQDVRMCVPHDNSVPLGRFVVVDFSGQLFILDYRAPGTTHPTLPTPNSGGAPDLPTYSQISTSPKTPDVAFVFDNQVYIKNLDPNGGGVSRFTSGVGFYSFPVWSSDGNNIAYLSQVNDRYEIWAASRFGGNNRVLLSSNNPMIPKSPRKFAWIDNYILYISAGTLRYLNVADRHVDTFKYLNTDTGEVVPISADQVAISPDGHFLAYSQSNSLHILKFVAPKNTIMPGNIQTYLQVGKWPRGVEVTNSFFPLSVQGLAWTNDGRGLVVTVGNTYLIEPDGDKRCLLFADPSIPQVVYTEASWLFP